MILDEKQKEKQTKAWTDRNKHVMEVQGKARAIILNRLCAGDSKADIVLLAELMLDMAKRMD